MLDWIFKRGPSAQRQHVTHVDTRQAHRRAMSGRYLLLHTYLDQRYADSLVLTFAQIEDVLGFALPEGARQRREWWTEPAADAGSSYADAWILAGRTAVPNLLAWTVAFDRAA